jgi:hypothetical protein
MATKFDSSLLVEDADVEDFDRVRAHVCSLSPVAFVAVMNSGVVTKWVREQFAKIERRKAARVA